MEKQEDATSTFNKILDSLLSHLEKSNLQEAENGFANCVKKFYTNEDKTFETAVSLKGLGKVYNKRGCLFRNGSDIVKSTALFMSSLTRIQEYNKDLSKPVITELKKEIENNHAIFIAEILQYDTSEDDFKRSGIYKKNLYQIREMCRHEMKAVDKLPALNSTHKNMNNEKERVEAIRHMYTKISNSMTDFISVMITDCLQVMSTPPCRFSVLGLGSTAREEATPFSDFEFCILVESDTDDILDYFNQLTTFLHLKVVELGETILPSLGIKSLNNYYSGKKEDDWFFDKGPRGFSFDGAMPWASKIPTGREKTDNKPWLQQLIKTPQEMARLLADSSDIKEGYHLADVLSTYKLIYGDISLFENYSHLIRDPCQTYVASEGSIPRPIVDPSHWKQKVLQELIQIQKLYQTSLKNYIRQHGGNYMVKNDFYRFPSLVVEYIAKYYKIRDISSWETISRLESSKYLSSEGAHNLKVALSIAAELRLRAYLDNLSQKEHFRELADLVAKQDISDDLVALLTRFFYTILPLEEAIKKVSRTGSLSHFNNEVFYNNDDKIKAQMFLQFRQHYRAKEILISCYSEKLQSSENINYDQNFAEICKLLGNTLYFLENGKESLKYLEIFLKISEKLYRVNPIVSNAKHVADSNQNYGCVLSALQNKKDSFFHFNKALEIRLCLLGQCSTKVETITCLEDLVDVHYNICGLCESPRTMRDISIFAYHIEKAMDICKKMLQQYDNAYYIYPSLYSRQGLLYYNTGNYRESVNAYNISLQLFYEHKKYDMNTGAEASILNNFGNALIEIGEFDLAMNMHKRCYDIRLQIHGNKDHNSIARSLNNFGLINKRRGNYQAAHAFFTQARDMSLRINGANSSYPHLKLYENNVRTSAEQLKNINDAK